MILPAEVIRVVPVAALLPMLVPNAIPPPPVVVRVRLPAALIPPVPLVDMPPEPETATDKFRSLVSVPAPEIDSAGDVWFDVMLITPFEALLPENCSVPAIITCFVVLDAVTATATGLLVWKLWNVTVTLAGMFSAVK